MNDFGSQPSDDEQLPNDIKTISIDRDALVVRIQSKSYVIDSDKMKLDEIIGA